MFCKKLVAPIELLAYKERRIKVYKNVRGLKK